MFYMSCVSSNPIDFIPFHTDIEEDENVVIYIDSFSDTVTYIPTFKEKGEMFPVSSFVKRFDITPMITTRNASACAGLYVYLSEHGNFGALERLIFTIGDKRVLLNVTELKKSFDETQDMYSYSSYYSSYTHSQKYIFSIDEEAFNILCSLNVEF